MTDLTKIPSAKNITEDWGERCSDFAPECPCCQMWAMRDAIDSLSSENAALKAELDRMMNACRWYWPDDDTSSEACADCPQEVVQNVYEYGPGVGEVVAVARGGVVDVTYCAAIPPAEDSDSDDDFWVEEKTEEAAKAKIDAELARRAALTDQQKG
jgi:hypothetical protein